MQRVRNTILPGVSTTVMALLALLVGAMAPVAASTPSVAADLEPGAVRMVVKYYDEDGRQQPAPGVEVFLLEVEPTAAETRHRGPGGHPIGNERYKCTDSSGVAVFWNVPAGRELWAEVGIGSPDRCSNAAYLNPSNGKKMLAVDWAGNHGGGLYEPFTIESGERRRVKMVATTPEDQTSVCGGYETTWVGTTGNDTFEGTPSKDVVNSLDGDDVINGNGGDDVICAGAGDDVVSGGAGLITYFGEDGDDHLIGGSKEDWFFGGAGNDTIEGYEGADILSGGPGNDDLDGGPGNDRILGEAGKDVITDGSGDDIAAGGAGRDRLFVGEGTDTLNGGSGLDWLDFSLATAAMTIDLETGAASGSSIGTKTVNGIERVRGTYYADTIYGNESDNYFIGLSKPDVIWGRGGDDIIYGGAGADYLVGNAGNDTLIGGLGTDTANGGKGRDTCSAETMIKCD